MLESACSARILTYCATHALPYPRTPTGVSCLSSELFSSLSACRKGFFDTLKAEAVDPHGFRFILYMYHVPKKLKCI